MDIISHTLTGVAVGTVVATYSDQSWRSKTLIILTGGFGGALPDLDAVSLWYFGIPTMLPFIPSWHQYY